MREGKKKESRRAGSKRVKIAVENGSFPLMQ